MATAGRHASQGEKLDDKCMKLHWKPRLQAVLKLARFSLFVCNPPQADMYRTDLLHAANLMPTNRGSWLISKVRAPGPPAGFMRMHAIWMP